MRRKEQARDGLQARVAEVEQQIADKDAQTTSLQSSGDALANTLEHVNAALTVRLVLSFTDPDIAVDLQQHGRRHTALHIEFRDAVALPEAHWINRGIQNTAEEATAPDFC